MLTLRGTIPGCRPEVAADTDFESWLHNVASMEAALSRAPKARARTRLWANDGLETGIMGGCGRDILKRGHSRGPAPLAAGILLHDAARRQRQQPRSAAALPSLPRPLGLRDSDRSFG